MTKKTCHTISCCITGDILESKVRIKLLALNAISERFALATLVLTTPFACLSCQAYDFAGPGKCHEQLVSWMLIEDSEGVPSSLLTHDLALNKLWQLLCENPLSKLN